MRRPTSPSVAPCLSLLLVALASPACSAGGWGERIEFLDDLARWSGHACGESRDPYEERIETERHDFTQSAVTVGRGVVQIEGGYSFFYKDAHDEVESSHTGPELMLRYGLSEDIEVRLRWNYAWVFPEEEESRVGAEDLRYALKLQITREDCRTLLPTSALEIRGTAPSGGDAFSTDQAEFSLDYIYQWRLTERSTIAGSTGFGTNGFGDFGLAPQEPTEGDFTFLTQSAVLGLELSEANTLYAEWYGIFTDGREDERTLSFFNIGVDHYVTDDFVLDVRIGAGLNADSDDLFVGVGGGYRY